jgi:hypothetical protein
MIPKFDIDSWDDALEGYCFRRRFAMTGRTESGWQFRAHRPNLLTAERFSDG